MEEDSLYYIEFDKTYPHGFKYVKGRVKKNLKDHYSNPCERWRQKIQPLYETQKDRNRLGRMIGGSMLVSEEDKKEIDAIRSRNKR